MNLIRNEFLSVLLKSMILDSRVSLNYSKSYDGLIACTTLHRLVLMFYW